MNTLTFPLGEPGSFLIDAEITAGLPHLFGSGTADASCVRHASYELRLGNTVKVCPYISPAGEKVWDFKEAEWQTDAAGKRYVEIRPKQTAHLYTNEAFRFGGDLLGFVFSRGLLHSKALTPETTYVDPGFDQDLYITIRNESHGVVRLNHQMHIARLFIFKLHTGVRAAYVPGGTLGIEQQLTQLPVREFWPPHKLPMVLDAELLKSIKGGCTVGDLLEQIVERQRRHTQVHTVLLLVTIAGLITLAAWNPVLLRLVDAGWIRSTAGEVAKTAAASGIVSLLAFAGLYLLTRLKGVKRYLGLRQ